ncbi:bacillithiol biosynthesis cysteine-adding enzyme BshC [Cohnella suwonensis]|uniref:Putative cysteine ligase BshC n=1 Tax=Cohnella suwonensis TaxID=696072 RepID=A0ABW0LQQ0_9BACL
MTTYEELDLRTIAAKYRSGDESVVGLFGGHPEDRKAWAAKAAKLDSERDSRASLSAVADAIRDYHSKLPASEETERSLRKLERGDALVVVGGQQAGLFGGALLIYYKALTVIQAAREAELALGRPVVPVFWIAGEDHDYDEANHVNVLSAEGGIRRVRVERPDGPRLAVSRTPVSYEQWESALQELAAQLPDTEYKPALLEKLRAHCADAPTLSLAFARLLADWFGSQGLLLLDADDAKLRAIEGPMFKRLIERNGELEDALKVGERLVRERGFPLQAETAQGGANLFLHHEQGRLLLFKEGEAFADRKGIVKLPKEEMTAQAADCPEKLSTNALTRPLMQDYVLPVLAAVLGPSELAYWGILGPAFETFGMSIPILVPRQSFTYLEPGVMKLIDKFGLTTVQAMTEWEERKAEWLARQDEWQLEERFAEVKRQFAELYAPMMDTVSSILPSLAKLAETNRDKIIEQISYLESRSIDSVAKRHEASLKQWDRIRLSLSPMDKPQERVYGTIHFLNRYGPEWMSLWNRAPFQASGGHRLAEGMP